MPRHPDAVIAPNTLLSDARKRLASPHRPGQHMSRAELADAVNAALDRLYPGQNLSAHYVDFRWIGKLERGEHRWPSEERRSALRHVLHAGTDTELDLYSPRRSADTAAVRVLVDEVRPAPLTTGTSADDPVASGKPETVEAWLQELDRLTLLAVPRVPPDLDIQVRDLLAILDQLQRDGTRHDLARVDARWSEFMSWIADNAGDPDGGSWLDRSHRRASEAGDQLLGAYTLMRQSQRALDDGDVRTAIALSRRSLTHGPVPPRTRVLCLTRMAEGLASSGDDDTHAVIAAARRGLGRVAHDAADGFAKHCDLRYVTAVDARCRQLLGDPSSAASILEELLIQERSTAPLDAGVWHAYLGECHLLDDPERAATHGLHALRLARESGSYRIIRAAQPLAIALRRHRVLPVVNEFVTAHRSTVSGR